MKQKILYIHGFNSGPGDKVETFKEHFPDCEIISPQLPNSHFDSIDILSKIIDDNENIHIVGTSLGGYYGMILNHIYSQRDDILFYIINPMTNVKKFIKSKVGKEFTNYKTNETFTYDYGLGKELEVLNDGYEGMRMTLDDVIYNHPYFFIGNNDEVINHKKLIKKLKKSKKPYHIFEDNQDHRYSDLTKVIEIINKNKHMVV